MLEVGLAGARFFHLACAIILFGGASFVLYARPDAGGSRRLALLPAILAAAALGALLSGLAWFVLTAANMSGALVGALDRETLSSVLWDTSFGLVWALRVPLMILILAVIWWRRASALSRRAIALLSFLAAILLASLAGVGHTQVHEGVSAGVHVAADAVHLLAAGAWLGGLLPLCLFLAPDRTAQVSNDEAVRILSRFSGMGYVAVAVLIASGSINSWFLIGSLPHLIDTSSGHRPIENGNRVGTFAGKAPSSGWRGTGAGSSRRGHRQRVGNAIPCCSRFLNGRRDLGPFRLGRQKARQDWRAP